MRGDDLMTDDWGREVLGVGVGKARGGEGKLGRIGREEVGGENWPGYNEEVCPTNWEYRAAANMCCWW